jgi:hypothetical protein
MDQLEDQPTSPDAKRGGSLRGRAVSLGKIFLTIALTAIVSNIVTYQMWLTQQGVTYRMWLTQQDNVQAWNSRPVVEVKIDAHKGKKDLTIRNLGRIDISDVKIYLTVYELSTKLIDAGHHTTWDGIATFSKIGPLRTFSRIPGSGGLKSINLLTEFKQFAPMRKWEPAVDDKLMNTYYAYRVTLRNDVTKQRYVALVFATPFSDFNANLFGEAETSSVGGGYAAGRHLIELRNLLKRDQLDLFDDSPADLLPK